MAAACLSPLLQVTTTGNTTGGLEGEDKEGGMREEASKNKSLPPMTLFSTLFSPLPPSFPLFQDVILFSLKKKYWTTVLTSTELRDSVGLHPDNNRGSETSVLKTLLHSNFQVDCMTYSPVAS